MIVCRITRDGEEVVRCQFAEDTPPVVLGRAVTAARDCVLRWSVEDEPTVEDYNGPRFEEWLRIDAERQMGPHPERGPYMTFEEFCRTYPNL